MRRAVLCAATLAALSVTGCGSSKRQPVVQPITLMMNGTISPATVSLVAGDSVIWTNQDTLAHGLFSDDAITFGTAHELPKLGGTFGFRFTFPGTYGYRWTTVAKPSAPAARATVEVSAPPTRATTPLGL